jgi:hypothetical protein
MSTAVRTFVAARAVGHQVALSTARLPPLVPRPDSLVSAASALSAASSQFEEAVFESDWPSRHERPAAAAAAVAVAIAAAALAPDAHLHPFQLPVAASSSTLVRFLLLSVFLSLPASVQP